MVTTSWVHLPSAVLKLNFDGNFFKESGQGGWGVFIRDTKGQILHQFSGSVNSEDSNTAEVYAMLMSCQELLKLGSFYAIIEGDSFLVIQWG